MCDFFTRHLLRGALRYDEAAFFAAFGAEVDDPVGVADYVQIVFDDDGIAQVGQTGSTSSSFFTSSKWNLHDFRGAMKNRRSAF